MDKRDQENGKKERELDGSKIKTQMNKQNRNMENYLALIQNLLRKISKTFLR